MSSTVTEAPSLNLGRSMGWMFASQNWLANLFWACLCALLGMVLIGNFVLLGYQMEIIQRRSRGGQNSIVDFDSSKFGDYLVRGILPAVVYFVIGLAVSSVTTVLMFVWMGLFTALVGKNPQDGMALLMLLPLIGVVLLQIAVIFGVALPLAMRTGLANDISEGFKLNWALQTAKMMWPHMLLCLLYIFLCSLLSMVGILFCFIGLFITTAWLQLVAADLAAQLYDIYLWKGGQPVPMDGEAVQAEII